MHDDDKSDYIKRFKVLVIKGTDKPRSTSTRSGFTLQQQFLTLLSNFFFLPRIIKCLNSFDLI